MRASIWLKFGTHIEGLKANTTPNFGVNLINIQGIISGFTHNPKLNFCHAYTALRNKLKIGMKLG